MSAGKPNWGRLAALGRLPQEQRHNLPGAEEIAELEAENAELRAKSESVSQPEEVVEQPGTMPLREDGETTPEFGDTSTEENNGEVEEEKPTPENEVTTAVAIDPDMKRNELEAIAMTHTTIQDPSNKEKYPNKAVLYDAIVEEFELK